LNYTTFVTILQYISNVTCNKIFAFLLFHNVKLSIFINFSKRYIVTK